MNNLWESVGNKCLEHAEALLGDKETAINEAALKAVRELVEIAIAIDSLNLRWAEQSRYGAPANLGLPLGQKAKEN